MENSKQNLKEFIKYELEINGFHNTEISTSINKLVDTLYDYSNQDRAVLHHLFSMTHNLLQHNPVSPITEQDFKKEVRDDGKTILKCVRYPWIYRDTDGKYYNDRAIEYIKDNHRMYQYQGKLNSKQEIKLPYSLKKQQVNLDDYHLDNGQ